MQFFIYTRKILWPIFGLVSCALAAGYFVPWSQPKREQVDLVYATPEGIRLTLDIVYPMTGSAPYPVAIFIPPQGDWISVFKQFEQFRTVLDTASTRGYAIVLPHYRDPKFYRFRASIEDLKASVRWVRAHGSQYGIKTERIGVAGVSAGGYAACMLGTTDPKDGFEGTGGNTAYSSRVQAVVSMGAPLDFERRTWDDTVESHVFKPLFGVTWKENPALYKKACPGRYAGPDDPPFLLFHSTNDKNIPIHHARAFTAQVQRAGGSIQLVEIDSSSHICGGPELQQAIAQGLDFFDRHIR